MNRFKNVLYYADHKKDQTHALQRVIQLAKANQGTLTVIDVIVESDMNYDINQEYGIDLHQMHIAQRLKDLEELVAPYSDLGVKVSCEIMVGTPFIELIRAVQRNKYDLLVKIAQAPEGIIDRLFGSTDMHLLRKCPCPVWIDGPHSVYPYNNILAAVDPCDEDCQDLNKLIMDLSTSLAKMESANLHVVHAWRLEGESYLRSPRVNLTNEQVDALATNTQNKHSKQLNKILHEYDMSVDSDNVSLVKAVPYKGILAKAKEIRADLIVMGTVGRSGLPGFFIGNTAEDVLQGAPCSVLAVKPDGFVSPVTVDD
jgi:nucleotide-binding universal stress UspA family protein